MIMGFAGNSISTNLARDLGTRIVAAIFFGMLLPSSDPLNVIRTNRLVLQAKKHSHSIMAIHGSLSL